MLCLFRVCDELLCWVFFFFLINCVRVLGLHVGDGGDEREREREKLEGDINIFYYVNILF